LWFLAVKKSGKLRISIDTKPLNAAIFRAILPADKQDESKLETVITMEYLPVSESGLSKF